MIDTVMIKLWLPDHEALNKVLSTASVSMDCGAPKQDEQGNFVVTVYASPAEAKKIAALQFKSETDENFGQKLKERQDEVSKTDRFDGGKILPKGLGTLR